MVKNVALVLGGGGSAGHAWTIGVIAGLAEGGVDMTEAADLVIGTSSGATAAAQVRSGIPPAELLASILSEPVPPVGQHRPPPPGPPMTTVLERMRAIGAAAISAADLQSAMGAFHLEKQPHPRDPRQRDGGAGCVAARLPRQQWPGRPMIVAAVNAHTGELAAFDRDSGVDLVDAVTASTALPRPGSHTQHQRHALYQRWRALLPKMPTLPRAMPTSWCSRRLAGRSGTLPTGQFEGLRRFPRKDADLASQVQALRKQGSSVVVITPDADSRTAMGTNQIDPRPASPPPVPVSPKASRKRPA